MMRMPWGKHCGRLITDISSSYLLWLVENCVGNYALKTAAQEELTRRFARPCPRCTAGRPPEMPRAAIDAELVGRWARQMAMQFHPDRGGSDDAMAAVNVGRDLLLAMLTGKGAS